jgi:Uma2 family endonuclease
MSIKTRVSEVEYPSSDGMPMAETDLHRILMVDLIARLQERYAGRKDVYVSGTLFVYYEEGKPHKVLAPDCFVVFGVPPGLRDTFKTWEEGAFPAVVFEFTSKTTQREDMFNKFTTYQDVWGVKEYFLFDPYEEYLQPSLLGYRLTRGKLKQIRSARGGIASQVLGVTLTRDGNRLVLRDTSTGKELLTPDAAKAEAEIARLKAELDALRRRQPPTK